MMAFSISSVLTHWVSLLTSAAITSSVLFLNFSSVLLILLAPTALSGVGHMSGTGINVRRIKSTLCLFLLR